MKTKVMFIITCMLCFIHTHANKDSLYVISNDTILASTLLDSNEIKTLVFCSDQKVFLGKHIEKIPISIWRQIVVKYDKWGEYNAKEEKASAYRLNEIRYADSTDAPAYLIILVIIGIVIIALAWKNIQFWK